MRQAQQILPLWDYMRDRIVAAQQGAGLSVQARGKVHNAAWKAIMSPFFQEHIMGMVREDMAALLATFEGGVRRCQAGGVRGGRRERRGRRTPAGPAGGKEDRGQREWRGRGGGSCSTPTRGDGYKGGGSRAKQAKGGKRSRRRQWEQPARLTLPGLGCQSRQPSSKDSAWTGITPGATGTTRLVTGLRVPTDLR